MDRQRTGFFNWRLKLILLLGVIGAFGVFGFARYVGQIDDTFGASPASWGFKEQSRSVQHFFAKGNAMPRIAGTTPAGSAAGTQTPPVQVEAAIFALG
jgi:hypothetical protein